MPKPDHDSQTVTEIETIRTERLELVSMSVPFMQALAAGDLRAASREIRASVPPWLAGQLVDFLRYRLAQLAEDPTIRVWLGRAMVLTDESGDRLVIGSLGFHGPPDVAGRLEVGYGVDPAYRREGYASEAVRALFDWAHREHGISRFVASIAPDNEPSLRLAAAFGFHQVGEQMDEIDGLELFFEANWPAD
jgi:ribosomal-protein-alanine N-acetyltransferase